MLERVWRKGNRLTLLVGMQTGTATVENMWRFLKKLETELLGTLREETKIERDTCNPVFIAALFTIARTWKQLGCQSADKWIMEVVVHIDNGILLRYKKRMHLSQL